MKSFVKGFLSLTFMLLIAGIFTMVPSFVNKVSKETSQTELTTAADDEASANSDVSALSTDSLDTTIYNGLSVYVIEDTTDLASVAAKVNNGETGYASANYYLKNDIDLGASSWTPIGTASHPFSGNFFGGDHTISNVHINNLTVDQSASSGIGLFGTVSGGTISDLAIEGDFSYMIDEKYKNVGTLVGNIINGELINVYDLSDSSYPSVGTATSSKYFRGYNSDFKYDDTIGTTTGYLTINTRTSTWNPSGRVAIYRLSTGSFYLADPNAQTLWRESQKARVVLSATNTETISSIKNPLYTTHIPRLRNSIVGIANVTTANKYVYPLLAGSRPSIPAVTKLIINGNVVTISFNAATEQVYLTYGYGTRSGKYYLPYDTAFKNLNAQYINRVGYTLNTINGMTLSSMGMVYNKAYPVYSTSADSNKFTWTAKTDNQFKIQFEKGANDATGWDLGDANFTVQISANATQQSANNYIYHYNSHTSGTDVTITFTLSTSYVVSKVAKETVVSGKHPDYFYSTNNQNKYVTDDFYDPANITCNFTRKPDNEYTARKYEITIENIVGNGGIYKIYIERADIETPVTFTVPDYGNDSVKSYSLTYQTSLDGTSWGAATTVKSLSAGSPKTIDLLLKADQTLYFKITITTADGYILNINNENLSVDPTTANQTKTQTWELLVTEYPSDSNDIPKLNITIGDRVAKVATEIYDENGEKLTKLEGATISINGKVVGIDTDTNWVDLTTEGNELSVELNDTNSIYDSLSYELDPNDGLRTPYDGRGNGDYTIKIYLSKKTYDFNNTEIGFALHENADEPGAVTDRYTYSGNPSFVNNLFKFSIKNGEDVIFSTSDGQTGSNKSFKIEDTLTVTVELTELGKQLVYIPEENFATFFNMGNDGISEIKNLSYADGTWTFEVVVGKSRPQVNVNFAFKNIRLTFDGVVNETHEIVADAGFSVNGNSILTGKYNVSSTNVISLIYSDDISSINLNTQYYLLGWYLQNGDTQGVDLTGQFGSYKEHNTFTSYTTANQASFDFTIKAIVGNRQIQVTYSAGSAGANGELVMADGSALANIVDDNKISYNTEYTVFTESQTFHNFGHNLQTWSFGAQQGTIVNGTITLTGTNWSSYFGADGTSQTWSSFANDKDTDGYNNKEGSLLLTAVWSPISYNISFDGANRTVQVGDTITFTPSTNPGKSGSYTITRNGEQVGDVILSANRNGYTAENFNIIQSLSGTNTKPGFQNQISITLSVDNMKDILADSYYYAVNDANSLITISTNLEPVRYKLYIEDSSYYDTVFDMDSLLQVDQTLGRELGGYEDNNSSGSFDEGDRAFIYIVYANPADELRIALEKDYLTISRYGYKFTGEFENFNKSSNYALTVDSTLTPIFTVNDSVTTASASIAFDSDLGSVRTFYLLNAKNIANGLLTYSEDSTSYSGEGLSTTTILPNGERVTAFGFNLYKNGSSSAITLSSKNLLDLIDFVANNLLAGKYKVTFFVTVQDVMDNSHTKTFTSSYLTEEASDFAINRNTVVLNSDNNVVSVFTNSSEFVAAMTANGYSSDNTFGTFRLAHSWNGTVNSDNAQNITLSSFVNLSSTQISGDYNVGTGKSISIGVSLNNLTNINNISIDGITNWNEMFSNVSTSGSSYLLNLDSVATIVKAIFTIDFGNASSYYFGSDGQTIVKENDAESISFIIGTKTFNYTYDKITYIGSQTNGMFTGTDMAVFNVSGISIGGFEDNWQDSFEYRLSGNFELIDMAAAIRKAFEARYLTASNGALASSLANTANGVSATISISNITYDRQIIGSGAISGEQIYGSASELDGNYTYGESLTFKVNNKIVFSFTNNGSGQILFYANPSNLQALSFDLTVALSGQNAGSFKMLSAWTTSTAVGDFDSALGSEYQNNSFKTNYQITNHGTTLQNVFAVLSDVRKVTMNYNGGKNADGAGSEIIYISAGQRYEIANPSHEYSGLSFSGYQRMLGQASDPTLNQKITAGEISDGYYLSASTGGVGATFAAIWKVTDIVVSEVENKKIAFYASLEQTLLPLTDFITENLYLEGGTFSYVLSNDDNTFAYQNGQFIITDANDTTPSTLSGTYTLTITLSYSDAISGESEVPKPLTGYELKIDENVMAFDERTYQLTYNNNVQQDFSVGLTKNGTAIDPKPTLNTLLNASAETYGISVAISGQGSTIRNAGSYTVSASLAEGMDNYFTLGAKTTFTVQVKQYPLDLAAYVDQISFSKELGAADPTPLQTEITIAANNSERVLIAFDRDKGETAGSYDLINPRIVESDDRNNYELVGSLTLEDRFEIKVPEVSLQLQMTSGLTYIYNGQVLSNLNVSFNEDDNSYIITGLAGADKTVSATFKLYYTNSQGQQVSIPKEEGLVYAGYINFAISASSKNAGTYPLSVSLTQAATSAGWSRVELVSGSYNNLVIDQRPIVVTSFTNVFNQMTTLAFTNVAALDNFTFASGEDSGIVSGDVVNITVTIASAQAGSQTITGRTLDSTSEANYELSMTSGLTATITPSSETVSISKDEESLYYGQILDDTNLSAIRSLIEFTFSGQNVGTIAENFLSVTDFDITSASYSTGGYLNANDEGETWDVVFTVTSPNFTFGGESENGIYETTFTIKLTVNRVGLTINNAPSTQIIKPYDGNTTVLPQFVGQEVNHANGYYTASGLLSGDKIIIASANYAAATIGSHKLTLNYGNDDSANYTITNNVQGEIGSVTLTFVKDVDTCGFVKDDGQRIQNTGSFTEVYSGGDDSSKGIDSLIESISNEDNFATRVGYYQKGWIWNYEGADIALDTQMSQPQKEAFLQAAVGAGASGLTLKVVWDIEKYDITFVVPSAVKLTKEGYDFTQAVLTDRPYWTTIEDILATAAAGYIVTGISANNSNVTLQSSGINTRNASFTLTHITGDSEITLTESEMQFKITLQTNEPQGFTANIDSAGGGLTGGWSRNGNTFTRVVNYTQAQSDLPKLIMTVSNTYGFNGWLLGNETSTGTIWERIGGSGLTQSDTVSGFTFTATWTESPLTLTINIANGSVAVYVNDEEDAILPAGDTNNYTVHFNDKIRIDVASSDWYKFVSASIVGTQTTSVSGSNATTGSFTIDVLSESKTITINTEEIVVTFNPSSLEETLYGTKVTNNLLKTTFTYSEMQNGGTPLTFTSGIGSYSATAGTYDQKDWSYSSANIGFGTTLIKFITDNGGIPIQDISYPISAIWQGEKYTVTFLKGEPLPNADGFTPTPTFTSPGDSGDSATRVWIYGSIIANMPELEASGQGYYWALEANPAVTFANGNRFTLAKPDSESPYELTLEAQWAHDHYTITINFAGSTDKIGSLTVDGTQITISDNVATVTNVVYGDSKDLILSLMTGYMVDSENTRITYDGHIEGSDPATLSFIGDDVTVTGVHGNIELTITVKAKSYTILVPNQKKEHVTASINEFTVSYDEDITAIFDGVTFKRGGYTISALYDGNTLFASCIDGDWQFEDEYVVITDNNSDGENEYIYQTDRGLTLDMVWTVNDENSRYFSGTTTAVDGLYYNASSQLVANSQFTLSEPLTVGALLENFDRVEDIYYMIGDRDSGTRVEFATGFTLYYTNAINAQICMVVELADSLSQNDFTYKIYSTPDQLVINASEININGSNIQSYFTGSSVIVPSNGDDYSNGTLYYHDNSTVVSELTISRVELVAKDEQYNVGNNYQVKYYFTKGVNFNIANYTGLAEEGEYIVFTPAASDVSATIVPSQISLQISGKAFENGSEQQVKTFNASMPDHVADFAININSIFTTAATPGSYDSFDELTIDYTITRGQEQIDKANFTIVVSGSYQIISSSLGYELALSAEEFNADEISLSIRNDILFTFNSFVVNTQSGNITDSEFSYLDSEDNLIFSISGNGTENIRVQIMKGAEVTFNISAQSQDQVLTWTIGDVTAEQALTLLQTLSSAVTKTKSFTLSESQSTLSLIVTKYKAISLSLGDRKGGGQTQGFVYIPVGQSKIVALATENQWLGFDFIGWTSSASGVSVTDGTNISVDAGANILAASVVANWRLQVLEGTAGNVERDAKPAVDSKIDEIDFEDVVSNLNNFNDEEITYSYTWKLAGENSSIHISKDGFTVPANIDSSGDYQIVVEASYGSYTPTTKTFSFHLTINKIDVGTVTINGIEDLVYAKYDYIQDISLTFSRDDMANCELEELLDKDNLYYYFTLSGQSTSEIKNAGDYTLTLNLSDKVFNAASFTQNIKVAEYTVTVNQSMLPQELTSKYFGTDDPKFEFTYTVNFTDKNTSEEITIGLVRDSGEASREYSFTDINTLNDDNYEVVMAQEGLTFEIFASLGTLNISVTDTLSMTYDKTTPTLALVYDEKSSVWTIEINGKDSKSNITLTMTDESGTHSLNSALYRLALENVLISANQDVLKAGSYNQASFTVTAEEDANYTSFNLTINLTISRRDLTINSVQKTFDRNANITSLTNVVFNNMIAGDIVTLSGSFASALVGTHALSGLSITGTDADNYNLVDSGYAGSITPLTATDVSITLGKDTFTYGDINEGMSLRDILSIMTSIETTIDTISGDIANGYISVTGWSVSENDLSTAGYLNAGTSKSISFTISSTNFAFAGGQTTEGVSTIICNVSLTIDSMQLDLSSLNIVKNYDETTSLPYGFSDNIDSIILSYGDLLDDVRIDIESSHYEDATIGENKNVTIVLAGEDSANYIPYNAHGTINEFAVTFNVVADQEDDALVSGGSFVDDDQTPVIEKPSFSIEYPTNLSAAQILARFIYPTRPGYKAVGWMIATEDGGYEALTEENILEVLREVAFDETNQTKSINIYVVWEIRTYSISVSGDNFTYQITGEGYNAETGRADYYSSVEIAITGERGYKYMAASIVGTIGSSDRGESGNANAIISLSEIGSAVNVVVTMSEINITVQIDTDIPDYTSRVDNEELLQSVSYFDLANMTVEDLPNLLVTSGTYYLSGFSYTAGDETKTIGEKTLKEVIDEMLPSLEHDEMVVFKAVWSGERYIITFDPNGGTLDGSETIEVIYGSVFGQPFPIATLPGRSNTWQADDGMVYSEDDIYHTIGQFDDQESAWKATLTAQWVNNPYTLTVVFDDKIQVEVQGQQITSGQEYQVIYGETTITLNILTSRGYNFEINDENLNGQANVDENEIILSNLTANGTIEINSIPAPNDLTYFAFNIDKVELGTADAESGQISYEELLQNKIIANTGSTVILRFTPSKGYELNSTSATLVGTSGSISVTIDEEGRLVVTWSGFTTAETLTVRASARTNYITYGDISSFYDSISFGGVSYSVTGGQVPIVTGQTIQISATLKYGYDSALVSSLPDGKVETQECLFNSNSRCYYLSATLTNIDEDFSLTISASPRSYNFIIAVSEGQEEYGEILSSSEQTVLFNESLDLRAGLLANEYIFASWQWNGYEISAEQETSYRITATDKELLESSTDGNLYIYASFRERIIDVSFTLTGNGEAAYAQGGEEILLTGNTTQNVSIYLGTDLTIRFIPREGYEIDKVLIDGTEINLEDYGFDAQTNTITLQIDVNDPIESIEISFTASDAYITVQAVVMVNYRPTYGVTDGGRVLLSDSEGNPLDESFYLENDGNLVIGGDYRYIAKTDGTVYFIVESNEGYESNFAARGLQEGGNYGAREVNGKTIYYISGVKEGASVTVTFTALANVIDIYFVTEEDPTVSVEGGTLIGDTSSPLVQINGNNSSHIRATVTTGANLNITVNAGISYNLIADENGYLKYSLSSNLHEGVITAGLVTESNIAQTGYSNTASLQISQVDGNTTIYIYVEPKVYNARFYVNQDTQITVENAITFGEEIDLSLLTQEQRSIIFQEREGYTLGGYYTIQYGQGVQYIDRFGDVTVAWKETGYYWNGQSYVVESNFFNPDTQTFTLYAAWEYDKSSITITFVPEGFENDTQTAGISDVIVNITPSSEIPWYDQNNKWYADVTAGVSITLRAYEFEGYEFRYWSVTKDGQSLGLQGSQFVMEFTQGDYVVEAVYHPLFSLTTNGAGGTTALLQDGQAVTGVSYDPSKTIILQATAAYGYNFLYWQDQTSGEIIEGQYDEASGSYFYTYPELLSSPLNLVAIFEGKETTVTFKSESLQDNNDLTVTLDGESVDISQPFSAKVGQTIVAKVRKTLGYTFEFIGGEASYSEESINNQTYAVYTYVIDFKDVVITEEANTLTLTLRGTPEEITLIFNYSVTDDEDNSEKPLVGTLSFIDANGVQSQITETNNSFTILFGQTVTLSIASTSYYRVIDITMFDGTLYPNLTDLYSNGKLTITPDIIMNNFNYQLEFDITFARVLWIDQEERILQGEGTNDNPYLINSEEEMAYVAYLVNEGIENEGGVKYSECVYELMSDLDFTGKYWVPIGTEENPFNGTMYLKEYSISNILHYRSYDPPTSYGGLFWILGEDARIEQQDYTLVIVLSVVGGVIFLILLALLIILLVRKKKKKEMEEIANG